MIMTAMGLSSRFPTLLLYNYLVRLRNKVITEKLRRLRRRPAGLFIARQVRASVLEIKIMKVDVQHAVED